MPARSSTDEGLEAAARRRLRGQQQRCDELLARLLDRYLASESKAAQSEQGLLVVRRGARPPRLRPPQ
jgi:hypothetical protein|eukprot:COSAG01_NODE_207_length_22017_cov_118.361164_4_plen_68_part_00